MMLEALNTELPSLEIGDHSVVVDLGANRGRFSRLLAARGARVLAFEPMPIAADAADKELRHFPRATLFRAAVTDRSGIATLYTHRDHSSDPLGYSISASLMLDKPNMRLSDGLQVLTVSIDSVLDAVGIVDLLKVDIEGSELLIWPSIRHRAHKIRHLLLELHEFSPELRNLRNEIDEFIQSSGLTDRWSTRWL